MNTTAWLIFAVIGAIIIALFVWMKRARNPTSLPTVPQLRADRPTDIEYVIDAVRKVVTFSGESQAGLKFLGEDTKELPLDEAQAYRDAAESAGLIVRQSNIYRLK